MSKVHKYTPGYPLERDIEVVRNDTFNPFIIIGWKEDGTPYDFSGHSFKIQIKTNREDDADLILEIPDSAFTITQNQVGADANVFNRVDILYGKDNMNIKPGDYVYDLQMTDAGGQVFTIYKESNYFRVKSDVTQ